MSSIAVTSPASPWPDFIYTPISAMEGTVKIGNSIYRMSLKNSAIPLDEMIAHRVFNMLQAQHLLGKNFAKAIISAEKTVYTDVKGITNEFLHAQNHKIQAFAKDIFAQMPALLPKPGDGKNKPAPTPPLSVVVKTAKTLPAKLENIKRLNANHVGLFREWAAKKSGRNLIPTLFMAIMIGGCSPSTEPVLSTRHAPFLTGKLHC